MKFRSEKKWKKKKKNEIKTRSEKKLMFTKLNS